MEWVIAALGVVVLGLAAIAAAGKLGSLPTADDDTYAPQLPAGAITPATLRSTRFGVALRGYDMRQVDALLDRLADQLEQRSDVAAPTTDRPAPESVAVPPAVGEEADPPVPTHARPAGAEAVETQPAEGHLVTDSVPARAPDTE